MENLSVFGTSPVVIDLSRKYGLVSAARAAGFKVNFLSVLCCKDVYSVS